MIRFNREAHSYCDENEIPYISVTTLIKKYSNEFDPTGEITERYAKKNNLTVGEVKAKWEQIADISIKRGKSIHTAIENYFNGFDYEYPEIINQVKSLKVLGTKKSEVMLHNAKFRLAGIADLIVSHNNRFDIYDYKTNKAFNYFNSYGQKLLYPLNHLDDCEYNKYALQLSLYGYLLGNIRRLSILWINHDNKLTQIPVPFMKKEVEFLLEYNTR